MTTSISNLNLTPTDPMSKDVLDQWKKNIFLYLNCMHLGTVQSFDSETQTCTATVNYTKTYFKLNQETGLYDPVQENYPLLVDVPVVFLHGAASGLTFPVAKGDECLLFANDRDIDNWFSSGQIGPVASGRLHSLTDSFALVGVRSTPNLIAAFDTARALLFNGTTGVGVGANKVKIYNNATTLNTLLQNILTQLENLSTAIASLTVTGVTTGAGTSGVPTNAATFTSISSQLSTLATQLGGLLE